VCVEWHTFFKAMCYVFPPSVVRKKGPLLMNLQRRDGKPRKDGKLGLFRGRRRKKDGVVNHDLHGEGVCKEKSLDEWRDIHF
jgi:hypothetical protein